MGKIGLCGCHARETATYPALMPVGDVVRTWILSLPFIVLFLLVYDLAEKALRKRFTSQLTGVHQRHQNILQRSPHAPVGRWLQYLLLLQLFPSCNWDISL